MTTFARDHVIDAFGEYYRYWHCPPPEEGSEFKVTKSQWDDELTQQHVYEWSAA